MHRLGIMQGRLSPIIDGKIQAFPSSLWREEFPLAKECGFDFIEWIVDLASMSDNPLFYPEGRDEMIELQQKYNVAIPIVCADFFMERSLNDEQLELRLQAMGMLCELIRICPAANIQHIEIPLIGNSSIRDRSDSLVKLLQDCLPLLEKNEVFLLMEMDLLPDQVREFLGRMPSEYIQMNYDTGNSAYWEFNVVDEIAHYGARIGNVHIKDCTPKDYSVSLGKGNVDFELFFELLKSIGYRGDFVLQAARAEDHVQTAKEYGEFTRYFIDRYMRDGSEIKG